jgi:hypothetical protein
MCGRTGEFSKALILHRRGAKAQRERREKQGKLMLTGGFLQFSLLQQHYCSRDNFHGNTLLIISFGFAFLCVPFASLRLCGEGV